MGKYTETATGIIEQVGGKNNIKNLYHCMTRLRFSLVDFDKVDHEKLKEVKGVIGEQLSEGELQVIIGPAVDGVCTEISDLTGISQGEAVAENLDGNIGAKKKTTFKSVGNAILAAISGCMSPLVPLFIVIGVANVVSAVIGPAMLGIVSSESHIYTNFYYMGQALIYALPILTAIPASKHFKTDSMLSLALACMMLYPDILAALGAEGGYTVYGIFARNVTYSGQIIPIILVVWIQSYVERFLKRYIPDIVKVLLVPFGTIAIMMPLMFCVLGPIGDIIGVGITSAVLGLYHIAGPVETTVISAALPFLTAFGVGRPLFFACMTVLMTEGVECSFMPYALCISNFVCMGCCLGYVLKTRNPDQRQLGITSLVANALGGVSEPTLFGIILPNPKTFVPLIIGGAVSGLFAGIFHIGAYQLGTSNVLSVLSFVSPEGGSNFALGCASAAIGFVVTLACMIVMYKGDSKSEAKAEADNGAPALTAAEFPMDIGAVADGTPLRMEEIADPVFAGGVLGMCCGLDPSEGTIYSPVDGTINSVADTLHAVTIHGNGGADILIHAGIDTVKMNGDGFKQLVNVGDAVTKGTPILEMDLDKVAAAGYRSTIVTAVANVDDFSSVTYTAASDTVKAGDTVLTIEK